MSGAVDAAAAELGSEAPATSVFAGDVQQLQQMLRRSLSSEEKFAYALSAFDTVRVSIREGRFDTSWPSVHCLARRLRAVIRTTTRRRLAALPSSIYLDAQLVGIDTHGRPTDIFSAIYRRDKAGFEFGAVKVFYGCADADADADAEWKLSQLLDSQFSASPHRSHVVQYIERVDLGKERVALLMPLYARSLHQLVVCSLTGWATAANGSRRAAGTGPAALPAHCALRREG